MRLILDLWCRSLAGSFQPFWPLTLFALSLTLLDPEEVARELHIKTEKPQTESKSTVHQVDYHYYLIIIINTMGLFGKLVDFLDGQESEDSGEETTDADAVGLSHVGHAAYEVLRKVHEDMHHVTWDVTSGKVVGEMDQTPKGIYDMEEEPPEGHSDWFPEKLQAIMERTEHWCDVMVSKISKIMAAGTVDCFGCFG